MNLRRLLLLSPWLVLGWPAGVVAQTPPAPVEAARYTGLHAAAWQGSPNEDFQA